MDGLYIVYSKFQTPFFPMFKDIFHSPYAVEKSFYLDDFSSTRETTFFNLFFHPFIYGRNFFDLCLNSIDIRYAINHICTIVIFISFFINKFKHSNFGLKNNNYIYFLTLFCFTSYVLNTYILVCTDTLLPQVYYMV